MKTHYLFLALLSFNLVSCSGLIKKRPNRKMLDEKSVAESKPKDDFDQFRRAPASVDMLKRKKRFDAERNDTSGPSLWTGKGTNSYLFTNQTEKQLGDIIRVNVLSKLKKEITNELKLSANYDKWERNSADSKDTKKPDKSKDNKVSPHDHISTVVEEEINQTHLLIKGRKTVLYKKQKKLIEFRALVARKDITENDSLESDKILESTVKVLR
ncbi:MAG: hypothetical protein DRQ88_02395 [Epsilonproteobacteria bacterium]|nr:MAG: hypothetical protein DRQ89_02460 [Campylobacterota bacterium]RLA67518.1 MAG: hypothetical protein DRQ88_02395 [Campylobacterota bacterium]